MRHIVYVRACSNWGLYIQSTAAHSTSATAPLLVQGPSFPPGIGMLRGAPIVFSGAPGAPQGAALQPIAGVPWPSQATPYASAFMAPPAWPM